MEKVEQYIQEHTRDYSNEYLIDSKPDGLGGYISRRKFSPWLTPDDTRKVAKITREEIIKEVCELFDGMDLQDIKSCDADVLINKLKKRLTKENYWWYLENELRQSNVIASVTKDDEKGFIVELKLMNPIDGCTSPSISLVFENIEELDALANGIVALAKEVKEQE